MKIKPKSFILQRDKRVAFIFNFKCELTNIWPQTEKPKKNEIFLVIYKHCKEGCTQQTGCACSTPRSSDFLGAFKNRVEIATTQYSKSHIFVQKFNFDKTPTFSRVFHPNFFWQFSSRNQSCQQLRSPKPQHFHEFFTPTKIDNFFGYD